MLTTPWIYWIAGFIEGEGHCRFDSGCVWLVAPQVQRFPLDHLQSLLGGKIYLQRRSGNNQPIYRWVLRGEQAVAVLMMLYPLLSPKRKFQVSETLAQWKRRAVNNRAKSRCKRGHAFTPENTLRVKQDGRVGRACRTCHNLLSSQGSKRRKAYIAAYRRNRWATDPEYRAKRKAAWARWNSRRQLISITGS